jgi:hypothetical protein
MDSIVYSKLNLNYYYSGWIRVKNRLGENNERLNNSAEKIFVSLK